jgi:hypothetical protein
MVEFDIPDATRAQISEDALIARGLFKEREDKGTIQIDDRVVSWQIRIKVVVAGGSARLAVFVLPSPRDGSLL